MRPMASGSKPDNCLSGLGTVGAAASFHVFRKLPSAIYLIIFTLSAAAALAVP